MQLIPLLIKVVSDKKKKKKKIFLSPKFWRKRHPNTGRNCPRGKGSYGLTLIRLQSAKDQWVGHINGRTNSQCAPTGAPADDGEGCPENARVMRDD